MFKVTENQSHTLMSIQFLILILYNLLRHLFKNNLFKYNKQKTTSKKFKSHVFISILNQYRITFLRRPHRNLVVLELHNISFDIIRRYNKPSFFS